MDMNLETPAQIAQRHDRQVRAIERLIGHLLRLGVNLSLALVILGSILSFARPTGYVAAAANLHHLTGPDAVFPRSISWLLHGLRHLQGQALIVLGLAVLIGTPVMRVAVSILAFAFQRDRVFVLITSAVLAILILSFILGKAT